MASLRAVAVIAWGFADAPGESPIERAERGLSATERHRGHPQDRRGAIGGRLRPRAEQAAAGDLVLGREREPRGEVLFGGPAVHVGANLGDEFQRGVRADAVNLREIDAAGELMQGRPDLEVRFVVGDACGGRAARAAAWPGPPGWRSGPARGPQWRDRRPPVGSDTRRRVPDSVARRRGARADSGRSRPRRSPPARRDTDSRDGWRGAAGSRWPATMSRRILRPVTPVMSLTTSGSWRFICTSAFCIRCT